MSIVDEKVLIGLDAAAEYEFCELEGGYSPSATREACAFDACSARSAVNFFPKFLRHTKGEAFAGRPFTLEEWQKRIIATLFGWKRPDGTRRYRTAYIEIPRKAGKSTLGAGIALYLLFMDAEPGAEIYSCAAEREQAAIVFELAKENVMRCPALARRSKAYLRSIVVSDPKTGLLTGSYKVLSADAHTKHGYNPHGIIFDELHAQPNRDLWDVMRTGTGARSQPLTVAITTAGFDKHSICWEQHEIAERVRDGIDANGSFLPVIYGAALSDDWASEDTWRKVQPNLGITVPVSFYRDEVAAARQSPSSENTVRRLYLNQWTTTDVRWLSDDAWSKCSSSIDTASLEGEYCVGALDLSTTTDITAFVLYFPDHKAVLPYFWVPGDNVERRGRVDRVPYGVWISQGYVYATAGNVVDYDPIRAHINALNDTYQIGKIARDRWNASQITNQLMGDGFDVVDFGQGFSSMSAPTKELERMVLEGSLRHGGNPVLEWMAGNVSVEQDAAGNVKPSKKKSSERIDGIVALVMAIGVAIAEPERNEWGVLA